jgi:hypothetical protein
VRIEAKIAAVVNETTLVLNVGTDVGVGEDDQVEIWEEREIKDPDGGESLGFIKITLARAVVTEAQEKLSVAQALRRPNAFESLLANFGGRPMYRFTTRTSTADDQVTVEIGQVVTVIIEDPASPPGLA